MDTSFESKVKQEDLDQLNAKVKEAGYVDREHLLEFLTFIPDNNAEQVKNEVKNWLTSLHLDPAFDKIQFPDGHIDAVIGDLDSYGRVRPETIQQFKEQSSQVLLPE